MKRFFIFLGVNLILTTIVFAQETPEEVVQQLEDLTELLEDETEDDNHLQFLEALRKSPLVINSVSAEELTELKLLTPIQIEQFIQYRNKLGPFISMYELQSIPYWDIATIKKVLPYLTLSNNTNLFSSLKERIKGGKHDATLRVQQILEKSKGFKEDENGNSKYLGSPQRYFFRYRYNYKNLLQWGIVGDKDAGEHFLKGAQKTGFDFYSFHVFAKKMGIINQLAIGDFTVNLGQGLIHWQSLAFKKNVEVITIKRQASTLRPYQSAGEFNFHRGIGVEIKKNRLNATFFYSLRKLSANRNVDTLADEEFISSILTNGYHRTTSEIEDRNTLTQQSFGGKVGFNYKKLSVGVNGVFYQLSSPLFKREALYNQFAISGKNWHNYSLDYSYTHKNIHLFGELAFDKENAKAILNGVMLNIDRRVDVSFLQRYIDKKYQSLYGNAFTESSLPTNESGVYSGISIRPTQSFKLDAYLDLFSFSWIKYLVDAPSKGVEYFLQATYSPNRQLEIYSRFRNEKKQHNFTGNSTPTNFLTSRIKRNWRTQTTFKVNPSVTFRNRMEVVWFKREIENGSMGFLALLDIIYKPLMKPFSFTIRGQYFETDDYDSRVYAYENDVLYSYSIPAFYDKGYRYYLVMRYDLTKQISFWLRWAQTQYTNRESVGSGWDEIQGKKRSEVKLQVRYEF